MGGIYSLHGEMRKIYTIFARISERNRLPESSGADRIIIFKWI
jgi:hypothetical protein